MKPLGSSKTSKMPDEKPKIPDSKGETTADDGKYKFRACPVILLENGSNFNVWNSIATAYLSNDKMIWKIIKGELTLIEKAELTEAEKTSNALFDLWNQRARMALFECISSPLAATLFHEETLTIKAKTMWDRVVNKHSKMTQKQAITSRFTNFRFLPNKSIEENVAEFAKIVQRLSDIELVYPNEVLCSKLLESLPNSWEPFRMSWASISESEKQYESLCEIIIAEAYRKAVHNGTQSATALFSQMRIGGSRNRGRGRGRSHVEITTLNDHTKATHRAHRPVTNVTRQATS